MYATLWEFEIQPGRETEFERAYGAGGGWVQLFQLAPGYLGTELLGAIGRPGVYITIDRWKSEQDYLNFRACFHVEHEALDNSGARLSLRETHLGAYIVLSHR